MINCDAGTFVHCAEPVAPGYGSRIVVGARHHRYRDRLVYSEDKLEHKQPSVAGCEPQALMPDDLDALNG